MGESGRRSAWFFNWLIKPCPFFVYYEYSLKNLIILKQISVRLVELLVS